MSRLEKMKLWKNKCEELSTRENEFSKQSIEMKELEIQLLEYELIIKEMTEERSYHSFNVPSDDREDESEESIEQLWSSRVETAC